MINRQCWWDEWSQQHHNEFTEIISYFLSAVLTPDTNNLLVTYGLGFKVRVDPSLVCFVTCAQWSPEIHLWCDTCEPLDGQHCSQAFFIHLLFQAFVGPKINKWTPRIFIVGFKSMPQCAAQCGSDRHSNRLGDSCSAQTQVISFSIWHPCFQKYNSLSTTTTRRHGKISLVCRLTASGIAFSIYQNVHTKNICTMFNIWYHIAWNTFSRELITTTTVNINRTFCQPSGICKQTERIFQILIKYSRQPPAPYLLCGNRVQPNEEMMTPEILE